MENIPGTPIPKTPEELFNRELKKDSIFKERRLMSPLSKIVERIEYPEEGGVLVYHKTFPYPEKGHRDDYVMASCQLMKRFFIIWIQFFAYKFFIPAYIVFLPYPWKYKIKIVEYWMQKILEMSTFVSNHHPYIFQDKYFTPLGRELLKGCYKFLTTIGVSSVLANKFSYMFVSFVDLDVAYRYRVQDILSETTNEKMLTGKSEINRILQLFAQRERRPHLVKKFRQFGNLITLILWHPRIKKAYRLAIDSMDFSKMGLDEADRYHVRNMSGYDFFGMTHEERCKKWPPEEHLYAEVNL